MLMESTVWKICKFCTTFRKVYSVKISQNCLSMKIITTQKFASFYQGNVKGGAYRSICIQTNNITGITMFWLSLGIYVSG